MLPLPDAVHAQAVQAGAHAAHGALSREGWVGGQDSCRMPRRGRSHARDWAAAAPAGRWLARRQSAALLEAGIPVSDRPRCSANQHTTCAAPRAAPRAAPTSGAHHEAAILLKRLLNVTRADGARVKARHKQRAAGLRAVAPSLLALPHVGVVLGKLDAQAAAQAAPLAPAAWWGMRVNCSMSRL